MDTGQPSPKVRNSEGAISATDKTQFRANLTQNNETDGAMIKPFAIRGRDLRHGAKCETALTNGGRRFTLSNFG